MVSPVFGGFSRFFESKSDKPTRKKNWKIDFFRFFQKCFKSCLDIIYGLETGFKHFDGDFYAIFDGVADIGRNDDI